MDALTSLLRGPRASEAFVLRMVMEPPWAIRIEDGAPLAVVAVVSGRAVVWREGGDETVIEAGSVGIVRGPEPYVLADALETEVGIVVHPGRRCEDVAGRSLDEPFTRGIRTWGNHPDGGTVAIVGTYESVGETGWQVLAELPPVLVVRSEDIRLPVVDLMAAELALDVPGQEVVLDRLLDLLAVSTLRAWFGRQGTDAPAWWSASTDPVVGAAIALLQSNPAHSWTVAELARESGVSRAGLARRFNDVVGQPPMSFLTDWRMSLAADLLLEPGATVQAVASRVGYGTGFAFSAAFKRHRGMSPTRYRDQILAA